MSGFVSDVEFSIDSNALKESARSLARSFTDFKGEAFETSGFGAGADLETGAAGSGIGSGSFSTVGRGGRTFLVSFFICYFIRSFSSSARFFWFSRSTAASYFSIYTALV